MCTSLAIKTTANYKYHVQLFWMEGHPGPTRTYTSDPGLSGPDAHGDSCRGWRQPCPRLEWDKQTDRRRKQQHEVSDQKIAVKVHLINTAVQLWPRYVVRRGRGTSAHTEARDPEQNLGVTSPPGWAEMCTGTGVQVYRCTGVHNKFMTMDLWDQTYGDSFTRRWASCLLTCSEHNQSLKHRVVILTVIIQFGQIKHKKLLLRGTPVISVLHFHRGLVGDKLKQKNGDILASNQ